MREGTLAGLLGVAVVASAQPSPGTPGTFAADPNAPLVTDVGESGANPPAAPRSRAAFAIDATAAATSNGGLDSGGSERADLIASVRPQFSASHVGAGLQYSVDAAVTLLGYARGTQHGGALPDVHGQIKSILLDNWFYVEGQANLRYAEADPFAPRADQNTGTNRRTESSTLVAPTLRHELSPNATLTARQELGETSENAGQSARLVTNRTLLNFERKPTPFGWGVSYTRLDNRPSDAAGGYTLASTRLSARVLTLEDVEIGADVGQDRSDYLLSKTTDTLYGGSLDWRPGPRTTLAVDVEHRFFGESGQVSLSHRTPFLVIELVAKRQPVDSSSTLGTLGQGTDLRDLLNAILTTRYPDPAARQTVVDGIISSRGLNPQLAGAVNVVGDYPQLQTTSQVALSVLGRLDTLSLTAYGITSRALQRRGDPLAGAQLAVSDNRQRGGTVQFSHRMTRELTAQASASWSRIEGLGVNAGELSNQSNYLLGVSDVLSPKSRLTVALQWNRFTTNVAGQHSLDATLALIGLDHRF